MEREQEAVDSNAFRSTEGSYNARQLANATRASVARRSGVKRIAVNPATADKIYDAAETELLAAVEAYKQKTGRQFPAISEVFAIILSLGYRKLEPVQAEMHQTRLSG